MKFLVDMPLPPALARWLGVQGHDAAHAAEMGMDRAPDTAIIERATDEGRTVVTADLDYPRLLALSGALEPSLVLFRGGDWTEAEVIERMTDLLVGLAPTDMDKAIFVIDRERIRRRSLPIG